ncbi:MAG: hypothetical protein AB7S81_07760 [Bdellovibrionales bacterium]
MTQKLDNPYKSFAAIANSYRNQLRITRTQEKQPDSIKEIIHEERDETGDLIIVKKLTRRVSTPATTPTFRYDVSMMGKAPPHFQAHALEKAIQAFEQPIGGIGADSSCLTCKGPSDPQNKTIITFPEILTQDETTREHLENMLTALVGCKEYADDYKPDEIASLFSEKIGPQVSPLASPKFPSAFLGAIPFLGSVPFNVPEESQGQVADYFKRTFKDAALSLTFQKPKTSADPQQPYAALISFPQVNYESVLDTLSKLKKGELSPQVVLKQLAI